MIVMMIPTLLPLLQRQNSWSSCSSDGKGYRGNYCSDSDDDDVYPLSFLPVSTYPVDNDSDDDSLDGMAPLAFKPVPAYPPESDSDSDDDSLDGMAPLAFKPVPAYPPESDDEESLEGIPGLLSRQSSMSSVESFDSWGDAVVHDNGGPLPASSVHSDDLVYDSTVACHGSSNQSSSPETLEQEGMEGNPDVDVATVNKRMEMACKALEAKGKTIGPHINFADSAASSHMGPSDDGMYDLEDREAAIKVGSGELLPTSKIGKRKVTAIQKGKNMNLIQEQYKCCPGLKYHLFSVTYAMQHGWTVGSKGKVMTISKDGVTLEFDVVIQTGDGFVCAVELRPRQVETAAAALSSGSSVDINTFHKIFNHCGEATLTATAKAHGIKLTGTLKPCVSCKTANARQKDVSKATGTVASAPGERLFIDISSIKQKSFGGSKYWLLVVDDKTNKSWSFFLKTKDETAEVLIPFLVQLAKDGTPVKSIRCDNAGENTDLQDQVKAHPTLSIDFEFTPRNSPQYNGKAERRFAFLWSGVRANLNDAQLPAWLRHGLWAEAGKFAQSVCDVLVSSRNPNDDCPYKLFHGKGVGQAEAPSQVWGDGCGNYPG